MSKPLDLDALEASPFRTTLPGGLGITLSLSEFAGFKAALAELRVLRRENEELRRELEQFLRPWNTP